MKQFGLALAFVLIGSNAYAFGECRSGFVCSPPLDGSWQPTLSFDRQIVVQQPVMILPPSNPHPHDEMPIYRSRQLR